MYIFSVSVVNKIELNMFLFCFSTMKLLVILGLVALAVADPAVYFQEAFDGGKKHLQEFSGYSFIVHFFL